MKILLVATLILSTATPVATIATMADAQVMVGRGASSRDRPNLTERREASLMEAEDRVAEFDSKIAELKALEAQTGTLTEAQRRQLAQHEARRAAAQRDVERLLTLLNR